MKKAVKILAAAMCIIVLFTSTVFGDYVYNYSSVSQQVKVIDGIKEFFGNVGYILTYTSKTPTKSLCKIPELEKNYVPQGFCYVDSQDMFAVTYYSADDLNSIVALIDATSGERIKTVVLHYEDGSDCKAHVGGCADIGDSLIISAGKSARRLKIADILEAEDYGNVNFCGKLKTDMQASYLNAYKNLLIVGQFYTFTPDNQYETPKEHSLYFSKSKHNYAMCEVFDLRDMDAVFESETATPMFMVSVPNSIQGVAYDGTCLVTSSSSTAYGNSFLRYYNLEKATVSEYNLGGTDVNLYIITEDMAEKTVKIEPMSEGIDFYGDKVAGIFESGAKKFTARKKMSDICVFE